MRKIQRRDFLKAMGLATAALGLTACGGSGAASASSVSSAPASSSSAPSASAQPESAETKAAPAGPPVTQFQTGELTIGDYTFKAQYIPTDVRREVCGACSLIKGQHGKPSASANEDNEEFVKIRAFTSNLTDPGSRATLTEVTPFVLYIDRNGILYAMDPFDVLLPGYSQQQQKSPRH